MQLLDATVFKTKALLERPDESTREDTRKRVLDAMIRRGGASALSNMTTLFCSFDEDGNGVLSFNEFKRACSSFGLEGVTDEDLRELFHSMVCMCIFVCFRERGKETRAT